MSRVPNYHWRQPSGGAFGTVFNPTVDASRGATDENVVTVHGTDGPIAILINMGESWIAIDG